MYLLLLSCMGTASESTPSEKEQVPLEITAASVSCDPMTARWSFLVQTNGWTGNGQVVLSDDGSYVEVHPLRSVVAAADGSSDSLELALTVVGDFRDVNLGSSTAFNCAEPGLAGLLRIFAQDGQTPVDCRIFGEDRWASWNLAYSCSEPIGDSGAAE